jgi:hypothetical protein
MCLTFVTAVIIILKHATFLHLSNLSQESALTQAEKDYHAVNMKSKIQKFLSSSPQNYSLEQVASFIEASDISLYILAPIYIISYQALVLPQRKDHWLKHFWKSKLLHKSTKQHKEGPADPISSGSGVASGSGM